MEQKFASHQESELDALMLRETVETLNYVTKFTKNVSVTQD